MTLGEKLSKLRKENNYTQEQLAELLGVSRQSVSKWESNIAYPETEKLIRLGELFDCSLDYLIKDEEPPQAAGFAMPKLRERKSKRTVFGLPLWHVGKHAKGIIAVGLTARGVVAVGLLPIGVISYGFLSVGIISIGLFALGLFAAGCISAGVIAFGAVSFGVLAIGAVAIGEFSSGALAVGKYFAYGDHAYGMIAIGDSQASGELFQKAGELTEAETETVKSLLDSAVPGRLAWAKAFVKYWLL